METQNSIFRKERGFERRNKALSSFFFAINNMMMAKIWQIMEKSLFQLAWVSEIRVPFQPLVLICIVIERQKIKRYQKYRVGLTVGRYFAHIWRISMWIILIAICYFRSWWVMFRFIQIHISSLKILIHVNHNRQYIYFVSCYSEEKYWQVL